MSKGEDAQLPIAHPGNGRKSKLTSIIFSTQTRRLPSITVESQPTAWNWSVLLGATFLLWCQRSWWVEGVGTPSRQPINTDTRTRPKQYKVCTEQSEHTEQTEHDKHRAQNRPVYIVKYINTDTRVRPRLLQYTTSEMECVPPPTHYLRLFLASSIKASSLGRQSVKCFPLCNF